jgi:hypothetical protein
MEDFIAYPSRTRLVLLGLGAAAFVALGLWMGGVFGPPPESDRYSASTIFAIGWICVVFFGLCGAAAIKKLFDPGEQLRIGRSGILTTPWSDQTIPWSEITDVTVWSYRHQKMITLHLRDPARFPGGRGIGALLAGANRSLTGGDISISMTATDRSFEDAMSAIARFRKIP